MAIGSTGSKQVWSGIPYFATQELRRRFDEVVLVETPRIDWLLFRANRMLRRAVGVDINREPLIVRYFAWRVHRALARLKPDIIISIGASNKLCCVETDLPILHYSDAVYPTLTRYYRRYARLGPRSLRLGNEVQRRLIARADSVLLASQWAVDSARAHYGQEVRRLRVVPMGANLDPWPPVAPVDPRRERLRLLFVGVEWERKGGPFAVALFDEIRRAVPDAELHIVGCRPPVRHTPGLIVHGFLDKAVPAERERLLDLYRQATFFTMFSAEEAYGIVYCEAAAFGLPSAAMDTGGVSTVIDRDVTGLLFDTSVCPGVAAQAMIAVWQDADRYRAMSAAARARFESVLNWSAWGEAVREEADRALAAHRAAADAGVTEA